MSEEQIVHETGRYWVRHDGKGLYRVLESGLVHSTVKGTYHFPEKPEYARARAIENANERAGK